MAVNKGLSRIKVNCIKIKYCRENGMKIQVSNRRSNNVNYTVVDEVLNFFVNK